MTRKATQAVLGRMLGHFAGGPVPSTRSVLREFRRIGGQIGNTRGREIVNAFREKSEGLSNIMKLSDYRRPRVADTMPSLFSEKTKYRYSMSNTVTDPLTGDPKTIYFNFNSNRLMSVGEIRDTIGDVKGYDDWHPEAAPAEDWKLEMIYRNAGPGVDITKPSEFDM
tara:strand:+ start:64 stop:564 length:501 start_codon:yes stop_codon:yes gene_type:complete